MKIMFSIAGKPVAQGRARFCTRGKFVTAYDPKKSADFKQLARLKAMEIYHDVALTGEINLAVKVFLPIPTTFSKKKKEQAINETLRPITRPDLSNYIKGIEDALNGIIYKDDSQIVSYEGSGKWYSEKPRMDVIVESEARK